MASIKDELTRILNIGDEGQTIEALTHFLQKYKDKLPLPGSNPQLDQIIWNASQHMPLSQADQTVLNKVVSSLSEKKVESAPVVKLKDLLGQAKEATISTWQDMLAAMSWQQMVPAGVAVRGVSGQTVSLGTYQRNLGDTNVQLNIGWLIDQNNLRILLQAKDKEEQAMPDVELKVFEASRGVVFSCKTNQDGALVAPALNVGPGQYQIQVEYLNQMAETPYFVI